MPKKIISRWDEYVMTCNGAIVFRDTDAVDACQRVCPGCYDDGAILLFDNEAKWGSGGSWNITTTTMTWTWQAHTDCYGSLGAFAAALYACICVPEDSTLRIDINGDRRICGLNPPGLKHAIYVDGASTPSAIVTTVQPGSGPPCTLSQGSDHCVLTAGLHCIFILSHSNGDNFDAGSVVFTLTPDGT